MGVFFPEQMKLRIPAGGLQIGLDGTGRPTSSVSIEVLLDVWPFWLDIGMDHAAQATTARRALQSVDPADDTEKGSLLGAECKASMVALSAAAFALDGFYAALREHRDMSDLDRVWMSAGTPRHARVSETLRRSFRLSNRQAKVLREGAKDLFKFRDWAVHPPAAFSRPVPHEVIGSSVEWRYVAFSAPNACRGITKATKIIRLCVEHPRADDRIQDWRASAASLLSDRWTRLQGEFGAD
jgi:hypothetical protein